MRNSAKSAVRIKEGFVGQSMIVIPPDKKRRFIRNALARHLYPTAIGYYPHASYHNRERKKGVDEYILLYCVSGEGWVKVKEQTFSILPNTCFIIPKRTFHHYGSSIRNPWSIYWAHFSGSMADILYKRYASSGNMPVTVSFADPRIELFDIILSTLEKDGKEEDIEIVSVKLIEFLSSFIYTVQPLHDPSDKVSASIAFMKKNLTRNISIQELADQATYSVSRYSELFRQKTGYSPINYFIQLKIQRSCHYLSFSKLKIIEICKEIGFDDSLYFSRMFKKMMGVSPVKYKKLHG